MQQDPEKLKKALVKYMKENAVILKKYKLEGKMVVAFPNNKKPSLISKFALWLLKKNGGRLDTEFKIKK